jgi:hypothetical protein
MSEKTWSQDQPVRNGFTLELGIGMSVMHIIPEQGDTLHKVGLAPLSLSLGGFFNNSMALMFRAAGTSYFKDNANGDPSQIVLSFYGVHFQYWINDNLFVSGGPGLIIYGPNPLLKASGDPDPKSGFGFGIRAGYSFANWENNSLRVSLELFPSFIEGNTVIGEAVNLEWQWF